MQPILSVTIPFFALVLCGYLAARLKVLPAMAIPGLNAFVLFFALPCMLFRFGASTPIGQLLDPVAFGVYTLAGLLVVALTLALTRRPPIGLKDAAFGAMVAAFPNTGFMGMPMMTALLGASAAAPMMITLLVDMFVISSICLALAELAGGRHLPWRTRMRHALRGPVTNPQPWAIALGALFSAGGWALPSSLGKMVELLGGAATPVALFTIGAVLWHSGVHAPDRTPARRFMPVALIKLLVHPLLMFGLATLASWAGAPIAPFTITVLTLAAALPSASNASLLAQRYGADNGRIARIIMASTALAFGTFTVLAWHFGVHPA
jgi:malonate transporter